MKRLLSMLQYTRPHGSPGEELFVEDFLLPYTPTPFHSAKGEVLAYIVDVADRMSVVPPVLFSSHVDTVHRDTDPQIQTICHDPSCGMVYKRDGRPLGADDTAGVWLLLSMIDAGVPGSYIFHRGEECGGIGSSGMAVHHAEWLKRFKWAIAFDRKGTTSIITEQFRGVCCSDEFGTALAAALNSAEPDFDYKLDPTGLFTDTANYTALIPECTNVSVGYEDEHTGQELLDLWHVEKLRDALIAVFAECPGLPVARSTTVMAHAAGAGRWAPRFIEPPSVDEIMDMTGTELEDYVWSAEPDDVADFIRSLAEEIYYARRFEAAIEEGGVHSAPETTKEIYMRADQENTDLIKAINQSTFSDETKKDLKRAVFTALKDEHDIDGHIKVNLSTGVISVRKDEGWVEA